MQVAIACRHGSIASNTHDYINQKSEKLLTYFERVTAIQVTIDYEKDRIKVEILVDAEHKHNFVARGLGEDVIPTFDQTLHKMEQQLRRYKEKIQDHRRDRPTNELAEGETEPPEEGAESTSDVDY